MSRPFLGSDAVAQGRVTAHSLRTHHDALYPNVYLQRDIALTAALRAEAAWLWSRRRAIVAGNSAAALHRAKWVDAHRPAELIHTNRRPPRGIHTWADRIADDEIVEIRGMPTCTPARAALDIACRYPPDRAVAALDALAHTTRLDLTAVQKLMARYPGRRGLRGAPAILDLVDAGAESPRETWLRLVVIRAGYPRPQTQVRIRDRYGYEFARVDLGWTDRRIGMEYEGRHHQSDPLTYERDIHRLEELTHQGWTIIRVTAADTEDSVLIRLGNAWQRRV